MSVERVKQVVSHLAPGANKGREALLRNSPDDVVITMAIRSPLCKAKKGAFKDTKCVVSEPSVCAVALTYFYRSDELLYEIFKVRGLGMAALNMCSQRITASGRTLDH